jgi:hypothetical protein
MEESLPILVNHFNAFSDSAKFVQSLLCAKLWGHNMEDFKLSKKLCQPKMLEYSRRNKVNRQRSVNMKWKIAVIEANVVRKQRKE